MFKNVKCVVFAVGASLAAASVEAGFGDLLKAVTEPSANTQQQTVAKPNENACLQCNGQGYVTIGFKTKKCKNCSGTGIALPKKEDVVSVPSVTTETEGRMVFDDIDINKIKHVLSSNKGCLLLDVREPGEFASGHLKGAVNVPVGQIATRIGDVCGNKSREIYVYCQSGMRSRTAARTLVGMGYSNVHNTLGGVNAWNGKLVR